MNEFPKFEAGKPALEQLSASRLNLVSGGQKSNQIQPGIGYRVTQTPGGTTVSVIKRRRGVPAVVSPLTIKQGSAVDKFQIVPGYVNGEMPTLGGIAINSPVAPATTPATPEITVAVDTWVFAKCVGTFGTPNTYVTSISTSTSSTPPDPTVISATGFTSFRLLGNIVVTTGSPDTYEIVSRHSGGNLGVQSYGLYNNWYRE